MAPAAAAALPAGCRGTRCQPGGETGEGLRGRLCIPHLALEDRAPVEAVELQVVLSGVEQGIFGHQSHDLGLLNPDPEACRLPSHRLHGAMDRGSPVVGQVHRHLGTLALVDLEAERLDLHQAAVAAAHGACDALCHRDVRGREVGVVRDQHGPGTDCHRTRRRVHPRLADVGAPRGIGRDGIADDFELSGAHPRQVLALGQPSSLAVEVDRDLQLLPYPGAERDGKIDRLLGGGVAQGHEWDHIGGAHPRVLTLVAVEVDERRRRPHHLQHRIHERRPLTDERDDAPVVVAVLLDVEQRHPWSVLHLGHDPGDLRLVPAL